jgi:hypothetical protein
MESSAIHSAIMESVNAAPVQGGFRGGLSVLGRILDAVKNLLTNIGTNLTPEIKATIETVACQIFDDAVVLPEPFDTWADTLFKSALDHLLKVS